MAITFANVTLCLDDPDHKIREFLDRYLPVYDASWFSPPNSKANQIPQWLPQPNWPDLPAPRINTLVVPTGATRWSYGLFLVTQDQLQSIRDNLDDAISNPGSATTDNKQAVGDLEISTDDETGVLPGQHRVKLRMHALPARKVSFAEGFDTLWILPLVDDRYFWQKAQIGAIKSSYGKNHVRWLVNVVGNSLSKVTNKASLRYKGKAITLDDLQDDGTDTEQVQVLLPERTVNSAALLDSVLAGQGLRLVPQFYSRAVFQGEPHYYDHYDCQLVNLNFANTTDWKQFNLNLGPNNQFSKLIDLARSYFVETARPRQIDVKFAKWVNGIVHGIDDPGTQPDDSYYTRTILYQPGEGTTDNNGEGTDYPKIIFSSALACDTDDPDDGINNLETVDGLASLVANACYAASAYHYDFTFHGVAEWALLPTDNFVMYSLDLIENGYRAITRVQSLPPNHDPEHVLQFAKGVPRFGGRILGKLQAGLDDDRHATLRVETADEPKQVVGEPAFGAVDASGRYPIATTYRDIEVTATTEVGSSAGETAVAVRLGYRWEIVSSAEGCSPLDCWDPWEDHEFRPLYEPCGFAAPQLTLDVGNLDCCDGAAGGVHTLTRESGVKEHLYGQKSVNDGISTPEAYSECGPYLKDETVTGANYSSAVFSCPTKKVVTLDTICGQETAVITNCSGNLAMTCTSEAWVLDDPGACAAPCSIIEPTEVCDEAHEGTTATGRCRGDAIKAKWKIMWADDKGFDNKEPRQRLFLQEVAPNGIDEIGALPITYKGGLQSPCASQLSFERVEVRNNVWGDSYYHRADSPLWLECSTGPATVCVRPVPYTVCSCQNVVDSSKPYSSYTLNWDAGTSTVYHVPTHRVPYNYHELKATACYYQAATLGPYGQRDFLAVYESNGTREYFAQFYDGTATRYADLIEFYDVACTGSKVLPYLLPSFGNAITIVPGSECSTSTSTTTSSTTSSTTTTCGGCTGSCGYWKNGGTNTWEPTVNNTCSGGCDCCESSLPPPTGIPHGTTITVSCHTVGSGDICCYPPPPTTTTTEEPTSTSTTTTTTCEACTGTCTYKWNGSVWVLEPVSPTNGCQGDLPGCICCPPVGGGGCPVGSYQTVPCTRTVGAQQCPPCPEDSPCYTTTTTSSTTTEEPTTTTCAPASECGCQWQYLSGVWVLQSSDCGVGEQCVGLFGCSPANGGNPGTEGQCISSDCAAEPTTTTTTACSNNNCTYNCIGLVWVLVEDNCTVGCSCPLVDGACVAEDPPEVRDCFG